MSGTKLGQVAHAFQGRGGSEPAIRERGAAVVVHSQTCPGPNGSWTSHGSPLWNASATRAAFASITVAGK